MALADILQRIATPQPKVEVQKPEPENPYVQQARRAGATEDEINSYLQPTEEPFFERIYKSNIKEPLKPSERGLKAAQTAATLGDTFGILAETFGASRGARVKPREFENSATSKQIAREKAIRDLYKQEDYRYKAGMVGAQGNDEQIRRGDRQAVRKALDEKVNYQNKLDLNKQQLEIQARKEAQSQANADRTHELNLKRANDTAKNAAERNRIAKSNKEAGATGAKAPKVLKVNTTENDPNATRDQFGRYTAEITVSPSEVENLANSAKADTEGFLKHPEYANRAFVTKQDMWGKATRGLTKDDELAWLYAEYIYKKKLEQDAARPSTSNTNTSNDPLGIL